MSRSEISVGLPAAAVIGGPVVLAALCAAAPLAAYAGSLAVFGLAHVVTELRYVDQRFSARFGRGALLLVLVLLWAIVALRLLAFVPGTSSIPRGELELAAVAGLAAVAASVSLRRGDPGAAALSIVVTAAIALGIANAPATTLVVLAFLHNLTPIGFLAERLRGSTRRWALAACGWVFVVVPAFLMNGWVAEALAGSGLWDPEAAPFGIGPIDAHLGVFVPGRWLDEPFAIRLFTAAAYLQCAHYAVVIGVLPRLGAGDGGAPRASVVPWPHGVRFVALTCAASAVALVAFVHGFGDARRAYGVVSALHAWSEVPVLLLSVSAGFGLSRVATRASAAAG